MDSTELLYPLRFQPIFRRYLWGGRRLATELGKSSGPDDCAESWEIVDRPEDNSVVAEGSLAGRTLHDLITDFGPQILGQQDFRSVSRADVPERLRGRFPLLLKILDANKTLSVQVHPDDAAGLRQPVPDLGKTEAWLVLDAAPGSRIYAGLRQGVDREKLAAAVTNKTTDQVLHAFEPQRGDCVFVPAGTVHAIGAGLLIAEIQQSSDTTYRLFDWNRVDADGRPRDLHIEQALQVTDYQRGPVDPVLPAATSDPRVVDLVRCDKFHIRRWQLNADNVELPLSSGFAVLMVMDGQIQVAGDPAGRPLNRGQTLLLPAALQRVELSADAATFLEIRGPAAD
jgi:mannose-6-phosphate isomerase